MNNSAPIHFLISAVMFFQCFIFTIAIFAVSPLFAILAVADLYCFVFHIDYARKLKKKKPLKTGTQESLRSAVSEDKSSESETNPYSLKKDTKIGPKTRLEAYDQSIGNTYKEGKAEKNSSPNKQDSQTENDDLNSGVFMGTDGKLYFTGANREVNNQKYESDSKEHSKADIEYDKEFSDFSMPDSSTINVFFGKTGVDHEKDDFTFSKEPEEKPKDTQSLNNSQSSSTSEMPFIKGKLDIKTEGRIKFYFSLIETYKSAYDWGILDGAEEGEEYPLYEYKKLPCQLTQDEEKFTVYVDPGDGMKYLGIIPRTTESERAIENGRKWHVEVDGGSTYIGKGKSYEKVWLPLHFYLVIGE
jgi:hypothetical protein